MTGKSNIDSALDRGVDEVIGKEQLRAALEKGAPLRLKMGFDPTAPDIHLGHVVGLRKLRQFQDMGHTVVLIVADWTARIGDPSGQSATRPMLTLEAVNANAETYLTQFFKVVDRARTEIRRQSEWFNDFTLTDVVGLTSKFTVAQFLAREDFSERFKNQKPIAITEFLYPLLQAYDSVMVEADVEFGGTDQKFNLLVGRDLQGMMGQAPQQCLLVPILPGTDGVRKMSKSLDNYIGVDEPPAEMYGKAMSLPDNMIGIYYELLTDVPDAELAEIFRSVADRVANPMDLKKRLARTLVATFHDEAAADQAQANFERTVQAGETPEDIDVHVLPPRQDRERQKLSGLMVNVGLSGTAGEAKRLIDQGAVSLDGNTITTNVSVITFSSGTLRVGKRGFVRLVEP